MSIMMLNAMNNFKLALVIGGLLSVLTVASFAQDNMDRQGPVIFVGLVGDGASGNSKVLLRWYSTLGEIPFSKFSVYRKPGDPHDPGTFTKITATEKLRNIPLIRSIFERPGEEEILADIIDVLSAMSNTAITVDNYAQQLIALLDGEDSCDSCMAQGRLLAQLNYGVSIIEGLGYLDRVSPTKYTYELRTSTSLGTDDLVIGRITIDASTNTELPAPESPDEVIINGIRGDRKIFLRWGASEDLSLNAPLHFGYNVYRSDGAISMTDTFESLESAGQLQKINRLPIMLNNSAVTERDESERYDFMDDNLSFDPEGRLGDRFVVGDQYTYWIAARDLLGRHGAPSDPIIVTIEDRRPPAIPRGLKAVEEQFGADRRINLVWNANTDGDTVAYHIYRYRWYHHTGRTGSFTDEGLDYGGLSEGYLTTVLHTASDTVSYRDTDVGLSDHESKAFWYCVSAIDASDNSSPLSPPVRGVLYDRDAPSRPKTIQICTTRFVCEPKFELLSQTEIKTDTTIVFHLERMDQRIIETKVVKIDNSLKSLLHQEIFSKNNVQTATDTIHSSVTGEGMEINYYFSFKTVLGEWCGPYELPRNLLDLLKHNSKKQFDIHVPIYLHPDAICSDATISDRLPHVSSVDGGASPLTVTVTLTDDAEGAILYRAEDCTDFHRVITERAAEGETSVTLVDTIRPGSTSIICYGVRLYDGSGNLSGMTYLESRVVFAGNESVVPTVDAITSAGTDASPEVQIRWFGPSEGISGYRIHFATGSFAKSGVFGDSGINVINSATSISSIHTVDEIYYSEETGLWSIQLASLDDLGNIPLQTNTRYRVWVNGIDPLGNTIDGKNTKLFTWTAEESIEERLNWPVRDLPDHTSGLPVYNTVGELSSPTAMSVKSISILLSDPSLLGQNDEFNPLEHLEIDLPFLVYRKRVDIAGQPYVQIGPLIETIETDPASGLISDPLIYATYNAAYYMDYVGLVKNASYRYIVVELDENGELSLVRGPTGDVTVTFD